LLQSFVMWRVSTMNCYITENLHWCKVLNSFYDLRYGITYSWKWRNKIWPRVRELNVSKTWDFQLTSQGTYVSWIYIFKMKRTSGYVNTWHKNISNKTQQIQIKRGNLTHLKFANSYLWGSYIQCSTTIHKIVDC
jgi:hypothetical protein